MLIFFANSKSEEPSPSAPQSLSISPFSLDHFDSQARVEEEVEAQAMEEARQAEAATVLARAEVAAAVAAAEEERAALIKQVRLYLGVNFFFEASGCLVVVCTCILNEHICTLSFARTMRTSACFTFGLCL